MTEVKLSDVTVGIFDGKHGGCREASNTGYYFVSVKDLAEYEIDYSNAKQISKEEFDEIYGRTNLEAGDVIYANTGDTIGKSVYIKENDKIKKTSFQKSIAVLKPNREIIHDRFLFYLLKYETPRLREAATGSAQKNLLLSTMRSFKTMLPSIEVQLKIAKILGDIDDKIMLNNQINRNLSEQIAALYQAWFIDFEPFRNGDFIDSEVGEIPAGWRVEKLVNLCDTISKKHKFDKDELIFLNTGDVEDGKFLHADFSAVEGMPGQAKKSIKENDILYSEIRPINRHFAFVNFDAEDYVVSTKLMVIRSKGMDSRRLYQYLTSQQVIDELQLEAESRSGTFPQIRFENVGALKMVVATDDVEKKYADLLQQFYAQIDENVIENQRLVELRDSLLPKLMSGELDVSDLDI